MRSGTIMVVNNIGDYCASRMIAGTITNLGTIGKQVGVFGFTWLSIKLRLANKPAGTNWGQLYGASILTGVGFTMSLFIGGLAFPTNPMLIEEAKIGILTGTAISAVLGFIILRLTTAHPAEECDDRGVVQAD